MKSKGNRAITLLWNLLRSPHLAVGLRVILGGLFVYASWDKILHPFRFAEDVANFDILPPLLVSLGALVLPWVEMITGLFLILGLLSRSTAAVLSALLLAFIAGIAINIARGADIDCGCFGPGEGLGWSTLVRDLVMLVMALQILLYDRGFLGLDSLRSRRATRRG